jgi:hypothetical protein
MLLTLFRSAVGFDFDYAGAKVHFVVADNGQGIPTDQIAEILKPFFTTRSSVAPGLVSPSRKASSNVIAVRYAFGAVCARARATP